jgi:hypothetical protein
MCDAKYSTKNSYPLNHVLLKSNEEILAETTGKPPLNYKRSPGIRIKANRDAIQDIFGIHLYRPYPFQGKYVPLLLSWIIPLGIWHAINTYDLISDNAAEWLPQFLTIFLALMGLLAGVTNLQAKEAKYKLRHLHSPMFFSFLVLILSALPVWVKTVDISNKNIKSNAEDKFK